MPPTPRALDQYHVFLASPGDVQTERQHVRRFFDDFNRHTAHVWGARFELIDWENCASIGVGRPQELITRQTLEKYRDSLVLVVGLMAQRFGSPTGKAESGTEEECNWALQQHADTGFPEVKWFFRKIDKLEIDPDRVDESVTQWNKVKAFRQRFTDPARPVWYAEYPHAEGFPDVLRKDLNLWLAGDERPWAVRRTQPPSPGAVALSDGPAVDIGAYQRAIQKRFANLNFETLDTTGAYYDGVKLWSVFVPQSVRECHEYNPRLLEIPKEHQRRLLDAGELAEKDLAHAEREAERMRQRYFNQPLRPVLAVVDEALLPGVQATARVARKLVVLGDPGAGKSSLIRYLALRWAETHAAGLPGAGRLPLVIELGAYARWADDDPGDLLRYLEEAPGWCTWPAGAVAGLLNQPGGAVLLLDGLDEVFDPKHRQTVLEDIQRFCSLYPQAAVIVTSRVVGYAPERLRDAEFTHFMLQDLTPQQIDEFLIRWHAETFDDATAAAPKRDRLAKAIRASRSIAMLAGNPLLLTMMAILNRHQELPRDRAELYGQAARVLLHQWDTERALIDFPGLSAEIGLREKTELLRRVAFEMQAAPGGLKGNLIDGGRLERLIEDYLRTELGFTQARAASRAVVEQLRLRNFILCFVGADSYAFVHRTFLEYFCAAEYVHRFTVAQTLSVDGLVELFDGNCRKDEWREVLRLICGQIDESFVTRIVEHLARRTNTLKWDGSDSLPELPLAIGCMGEARTIARMEGAASLLGRALLEIYADGKGSQEFHQQLLRAQSEVGPRWPGAQALCDDIVHRVARFADETWAAVHLVQFFGQISQDRTRVTGWLEVHNYCLRWGALQCLADLWPDEATRQRLVERAVRDIHPSPRSVALAALAARWPDDATRALLAQRAVHDNASESRSQALQALVQAWPDDATRALLVQRAVQDGDGDIRRGALSALAKAWPDDATRALLAERAVQDDHYASRSAALKALAEIWPNDATRALLVQRAVGDDNYDPRSEALQALAQFWPDSGTRALLTKRAVQDADNDVRYAVLRTLAKFWPDRTTRTLLTQRAVRDRDDRPRGEALRALAQSWPDATTRALLAERAANDKAPIIRILALDTLSQTWPDDTTRALLVQRVAEDKSDPVRSAALQHLAQSWPDDSTRALLARLAVQDDSYAPRSAALDVLAQSWPDNSTRALLTERATQDNEPQPRSIALQALAQGWPDDAIRALLTERATQDHDSGPRSVALQGLAQSWPDGTTRILLAECAVQDEASETRSTALRFLARFWRDDTTRDLIAQRAAEDKDPDTRHTALSIWARNWPDDTTRAQLAARAAQDPDKSIRGVAASRLGAMHSEFGGALYTRDLDGMGPYLDPRSPLSDDHIALAATRTGLSADDLDAHLASLSTFLGWDIRAGLKSTTKAAARPRKARRGRSEASQTD